MTQSGSSSDQAGSGARTRGVPWRALAALALLVAIALAGRQLAGGLADFVAWVEQLGVWGPLVFGVAYAAAVVAFVPGSVLTLGAGAIFGLGVGTATVFAAASIGACAAFLVARYAAREAVERRLAAYPRFAAVDRAVAAEGRKIVFLLRLSPVFPFNLLNYALGLTRVRFADYAIACLGMLPGTLLYVYLGALGGDLAQSAAGEAASEGTQRWLRIGGLVVTAVVTIAITRIARRALDRATGEEI